MIKKIDNNYLKEAKELYINSFKNKLECEYYFKNHIDDLYIVIEDNSLVSIGFYILNKVYNYSVSYYFGLTTKNDKRNLGYMRKLLDYFNHLNKINNVLFSFLHPENINLINYYQKYNFKVYNYKTEKIIKKKNIYNFITFNKTIDLDFLNTMYNSIKGLKLKRDFLELIAKYKMYDIELYIIFDEKKKSNIGYLILENKTITEIIVLKKYNEIKILATFAENKNINDLKYRSFKGKQEPFLMVKYYKKLKQKVYINLVGE